MTKKEYIFKFLDKVAGYWSNEPTIRLYLQEHDDEEYINYLYDEFTHAVDATLHDQTDDKVHSLLSYLQDVKAKELLSKQADEEDLRKLDQILGTL